MTTDPREAAWFAAHDALPPYWMVGPVTFDPGRGKSICHGASATPGTQKGPCHRLGRGRDGGGHPYRPARSPDWHASTSRRSDEARALNRRLRQTFYEGVQAEAARSGQSLGEPALARVLGHYPGDL